MKKPYYVIRMFRDGASPHGYVAGNPNRFAHLSDAIENARHFAAEVLDHSRSDQVVVGEGAVRCGYPVGSGKRLVVHYRAGLYRDGPIATREAREAVAI